ncbi:MAG TPA: glycosyltransferase family 4 protein [Vicinamibacterales bacterium]|nr:glycosyltransferase family 4 protein [Vicinamibacterales bacterium]
MRVVFLNPSGELGGAETALLEMLAALRAARPNWTLGLVASADGPLVERASRLGAQSASLVFPRSLARLGEWGRRGSFGARFRLGAAISGAAAPTLQYASRLRHHLNDLKPDIVHTNGLKMHLLGAQCRPAGAKLLWHLHDYPRSRPMTAALLRAQADRCAAVLANSESVAADTRALLGARVPVQTVYNAVDLDRFCPEGPSLDLDALARLPPPPAGTLRVGLLGTFARWKGHDVFLRALSLLRAAGIRGYIIGEPIYETAASQFSMRELQELSAAHGLAGSVGFTGRTHDVPAALRALDVAVHASVEPEPFGLVIAEAMACGRPVIVSRAGGAAEIAQAGALFHRPGDAADLAARISELIADPLQRQSLGTEGRQAAQRLFSRGRLAASLVAIYEPLVPAG